MTRKREEYLDARVDQLRQKLKDSDDLKTLGEVFDTRTLTNLYALSKKGVIDALGGPVSTGKEANIFDAVRGDESLAVKIYRIATSEFKSMQEYLQGDPRFGSVKGTKRSVIIAWAKKEFRNLKRAEEVGIRVPHPIAMRENILVMELVLQGDKPAPMLKDVDLDPEEALRVSNKIADYVVLLYQKAQLVHADLSEFNILYNGEPVIIDMGQSVTLEHPLAQQFLRRDVANLARYFQKRYGIRLEEDLWKRIK
jgi:RIO kinase 1